MRMLFIAATLAIGCGAAAPPPAPVPLPPPPEPSEPTGMPAGYVEVLAARVVDTGDGGGALLLVDSELERVLPIFIGGTEAASIVLRLRGAPSQRPLTHDLLDDLLHRLHATLVKVQVDELRDATYIGSVFVRANGRVFRVDARPSDAIALAIGNRIPIYVAKAVLDQAGIPRDELQKQLNGAGPAPTSS